MSNLALAGEAGHVPTRGLADHAVSDEMAWGPPTELAGKLTVSIPEAGRYLGIGRGAAYAAARRGELPTLRLGQRLVVPVPKLLELVGFDPDQPHDPPKPAA